MGQTRGEMVALAIAFIILPLLFAGLRFYTRARCHKGMRTECWTLIAALLFNLGLCLCVLLGATLGNLGDHEVFYNNNMPIPTDQSRIQKQSIYALNILYPLTNGLTKIAFIFLARRIFLPSETNRVFNAVSWTFIFIIVLWSLAFAISSIFLCSPISSVWNQLVPQSAGGTCLPEAFFDTLQITDIVTSVMVFALPIPATLAKSQYFSRGKCLLVCGIYVVGIFVVIAGAIRLCYFLIQGSTSWEGPDASYDAGPLAYWAIIETGVGISCVCLPSLGPLFGFSQTKSDESDTAYGAGTPPPAQPRIKVTKHGKDRKGEVRESDVTGSDKTRETSQASWPSAVWPLPPSGQPASPTFPQQSRASTDTQPMTNLAVPARSPSTSYKRPETVTTPTRQFKNPLHANPTPLSERSTSQRIPTSIVDTQLPTRSASQHDPGQQWPIRSASQRAPTAPAPVAQPPAPPASRPIQTADSTPRWPQRSTSQRVAVPPGAQVPRSASQRENTEQPTAAQQYSTFPQRSTSNSAATHLQTARAAIPLPPPGALRTSRAEPPPGPKDIYRRPTYPPRAQPLQQSQPVHGRVPSEGQEPTRSNTAKRRTGNNVRVERDSNGGLGTFYTHDGDSDDEGGPVGRRSRDKGRAGAAGLGRAI